MERRKFIKRSGQALLAVSAISITGGLAASCSPDDDNDFFGDGYYGDGYYDDGYYDDGYYDDGYYDDGYYDNGYYDDGYYDDEELINILLLGLWHVETYIDSGNNQTGTYAGYEVDFKENNLVSATNGSNTNDGTWNVSSSGDDLTLNFTGTPFNEFNDSWDVFSVTPSRVELRDVSGGGGGTDILVFEKI